MAQVDAFDGAGDVNELAGAQRPTAADIDQPRFTKDMTMVAVLSGQWYPQVRRLQVS